MDDPVDIPLSDKKEQLQIRPLQLYPLVTFQLPSLGHLSLPPLQKSQLSHIQQPSEPISLPPSYQFSYNIKYQQTVASEQFYPLCLALSERYVAVAGKSGILIFNEVDFSSFYKVPFDQIATSMDVFHDILAIGTQSGKIILFNLIKKNIITDSTYFSYSILRVKIMDYYKVCALDSVGGCALLNFNVKTILDKMIVTSVDEFDITEVSKKRNRDKIKKMWNNFLSKEEPAQTVPELSEHNNDFAIAYRQFSQYLNENQFCIALFRNKKLSILTVNTLRLGVSGEEKLLEQRVMNQVGMIKFGVGGFESSNQTHLFLVVSLENVINYFRFVRVDDLYEWHHVYTTQLNCTIKYGSFLSNNLIVLLTQRGIELVAVGQPPSLVTKVEYKTFNYINFFNSEENAKINMDWVEKNVMRASWRLNFLCCLEGKRVLICNIQDWKSYLQTFQNQNKWQEVIQYSMEIYHGKFKLLAGIPENKEERKKLMQTHFQSIILAYISFRLNQYPDQIQETVRLSIKFLLDTESYECLFVTVFEAFSQHKEVFFQELERFILCGKVKTVSNQVLQQSIQYYKKKQQIEVIEVLLTNLNLQEVDKSLILQVCLKERLFRSLINICVSTKDFITPMVKLSQLITLEPVLNPEQTKAGKTIISYIKNCLDGYYLDYHDDEKYLDMLSKLITYFMLPISLKLISKTDPVNFFRLSELFFEGRVFQLILENSERFAVKNNSYMSENIFEKQSCREFEIYERILKNIIFTEYIQVEGGQQQIQLDKFLLFLILKNQFPFIAALQIRACDFLIKHPTIFIENPSPTQQQEIDINAYLMRMFDSIFTKLDESSKSNRIQQFIALIYSSSHQQLLCESLCYLYHMQHKFRKVFEIYLKMKNKALRDRILLYLQENLCRSELVELCLNNVMSLLKIDEDKTMRLLVNHLPRECEEVINKLSGYPKYQLKYLELLFKTEHILKAELKLIHLNIVIKYQKNDVEHFLKSMDYPLDEAYRICEEAGNKPAMAYLAVKKGKIKQGLTILIDIFCELSDEVVKQLARRQAVDKSQLMLRLKQMIQVCADLSMEDIQEGQAMWFQVLQKIFKHIKIQNLVKDNVPIPIKELLGEIVQLILTGMCKYITVEFFVEKFTFTFSSLPINIFYKAYALMNDRLIFTIKVRNLVLTIFQFDHFEKSTTIKNYYNMGFHSTGMCNNCLVVASEAEDPKIIFRCQHTYHLGCISKLECSKCPQTESSQEPQILRDSKWVKSSKKNRLKTQKLSLFDEQLQYMSRNILEQIDDLYNKEGKLERLQKEQMKDRKQRRQRRQTKSKGMSEEQWISDRQI